MKISNDNPHGCSLDHEAAKDYIEAQLEVWPLAKKNYDDLREVKRRPMKFGKLEGAVQCNPARIRSTGAKVDKASIEGRPCFLCEKNRPAEQLSMTILPGWQLLVNPYPILPVHFTIVSETHRPQDQAPTDIVAIAERLPGMAVFFNGAKAGASAPDHLHLQAVLKDELPLLRFVEQEMPSNGADTVTSVQTLGEGLPFSVYAGLVAMDDRAQTALQLSMALGGPDSEGKPLNQELVNKFFWIDDKGYLRFVIVPRAAHRPSCYTAEGDARRIVSPGAIDMAGIIVAPRIEDFERLTEEEIDKIYSEVGVNL